MLLLTEIKKNLDGITFDQDLSIKDRLLERSSEILDIANVLVNGTVTYDDGLYLLGYQLNYDITLPSSRSMKPVTLSKSQWVDEVFIEAANADEKADLVEESLVLLLEGDAIDLEESVIDNILLSIPLQVLAEDELESDEMPSGDNWSVLTESQFEALQSEKKKENNPFAALNGLFEE